jgi:AraC-like DNA-binding protein
VLDSGAVIAYREFRPRPALVEHVECYWVMSGAPGPDAPIERILPDGCVEVVFHLDEPFRAFSAEGRPCLQPKAFVVGPSKRFLLIQAPRRLSTLGIRFRPAGARLLVPMPLHEIADQSAPLDDLIGGPAARRLAEKVGNASAIERRIQAVETALLDRLDRPARRRSSGHVGVMIREILRSRGQVRVAEIARRERVEWAGVAADCGYSDQAHLTREFRSFSGETPVTLQESQGQLSRQFTSPERLRAFFATA